MKEPLVSVIVPVYNVEKYLKRCVDSIIGQSYKNLEIILVDDGSTDESGKICDRYAEKDGRINVMRQKNAGLSVARNKGILRAKGDYVMLVDSDDWVSKKCISFLVRCAMENKSDIITCGEFLAFGDGKLSPKVDRENCQQVETAIEGLRDMLYQRKLNNSAWGKLYRKELFKGVQYPVNKWYEDIGTTYKLFLKCQTPVVINSKRLYYYMQRDDGISKQDFSEKSLDMIEMAEKMAKDVEAECPELTSAANSRLINVYFSILRQIRRKEHKNIYRGLILKIKPLRRKVLKDSNVRAKTKIGILISYISFGLVAGMFNLTKNINIVRRLE